MDAHDWMFDTEKDVDLAGFRRAQGKLLFAHGLADPIFSPHEVIDYYQRLTAKHGAATDRLLAPVPDPGMGHCAGGAAPTAGTGWARWSTGSRRGQAPQKIVATGTSVFPGRSRPLCPYPQYAHYDGRGNPEDAASFSCRNP
jgi:feruloyl esterase